MKVWRLLSLMLFLLVGLRAKAATELFLATHDGAPPFSGTTTVKVIPGSSDWESFRFSPVVHVMSAEAGWQLDPRQFRQGTGFIMGYMIENQKLNLLIATAGHVLTDKRQRELVTFFENDNSATQTREARVMGASGASDLAILAVPILDSELKEFAIPKLFLLAPESLAGQTIHPVTYRIPPVSALADRIVTSLQKIETEDTFFSPIAKNVTNPLSIFAKSFWYVPRPFVPGMSGGPLVVDRIKSGTQTFSSERYIVGALGYISDLADGDGYAYPLAEDYQRLLQQLGSYQGAEVSDFHFELLKQPTVRIKEENGEDRTYSDVGLSMQIFTMKRFDYQRNVVADSPTIRLSIPKPEGGHREIMGLWLDSPIGKGTAGGSGGASGVPGGSGGSSGVPGGSGGSSGVPGGNGGSSGVPGGGGAQQPKYGLPVSGGFNISYWGQIYEVSEIIIDGVRVDIRFIRELVEAITQGKEITFQLARLGTRYQRNDGALDLWSGNMKAALDINRFLKTVLDFKSSGPLRLNGNGTISGRAIMDASGSAMSGTVNFSVRDAETGESKEIVWKLVARKIADKKYTMVKNEISINGVVQKNDAGLEVLPYWEENRLHIRVSYKGELVGEVFQ